MIVNVCPAAVTSASPERIWNVLTTPERFGEWLGARFVSAEPPGPIRPGQVINLRAPSLAMQWPVRMDVRDMDPQRRWIDLVVESGYRTACTTNFGVNSVDVSLFELKRITARYPSRNWKSLREWLRPSRRSLGSGP